jgi:hypothetical protein
MCEFGVLVGKIIPKIDVQPLEAPRGRWKPVFSGSDSEKLVLLYSGGSILVFLDGI